MKYTPQKRLQTRDALSVTGIAAVFLGDRVSSTVEDSPIAVYLHYSPMSQCKSAQTLCHNGLTLVSVFGKLLRRGQVLAPVASFLAPI